MVFFGGSLNSNRLNKEFNLVRLSATEMMCFTAVTVTHMGPCSRDLLHELLTKLVCQQNARCNNNNGLRTSAEGTECILNHDERFTTTSRDDHLTEISSRHCRECTVLVGAEGNSQVCVVSFPVLYTEKPHHVKAGSVSQPSDTQFYFIF